MLIGILLVELWMALVNRALEEPEDEYEELDDEPILLKYSDQLFFVYIFFEEI